MYCVIYLLRIIIGRFWYLSFVKPGITCLKAKKLLVINLLNLFQIMTSVLKILTHVVWLEGFVKTRQDHFDAVVNLGSSETDTVVKVCQYVTGIYHINYGVIEGFLALRKAVKAHLKKYRIFLLVFDIANQLPTRHSHFAPVGQLDERAAKPSPSCRQWCSNFY